MRHPETADGIGKFEAALAVNPRDAHYSLRLFVTGTTPKSLRAVRNIREICEQNLREHYDLEVIDIYQHPELAVQAQIVVTPTLLKKLPLPYRRLIGDLSDNKRVLDGLDLGIRSCPPSAPAMPSGDRNVA